MDLMTKQELARTLRVTTRTIEAWVASGLLARPLYIGRRALWPREAIVQLVELRFRTAQTQAADEKSAART